MKLWMMAVVSMDAAAAADVMVSSDVDGALEMGVAGSGFTGSPSGMETRALLSWDSLLWTKATG